MIKFKNKKKGMNLMKFKITMKNWEQGKSNRKMELPMMKLTLITHRLIWMIS